MRFRALERDANVSRRRHFVNERGARETGLVAFGKLQLAASRTFISLAYRICAHRAATFIAAARNIICREETSDGFR